MFIVTIYHAVLQITPMKPFLLNIQLCHSRVFYSPVVAKYVCRIEIKSPKGNYSFSLSILECSFSDRSKLALEDSWCLCNRDPQIQAIASPSFYQEARRCGWKGLSARNFSVFLTCLHMCWQYSSKFTLRSLTALFYHLQLCCRHSISHISPRTQSQKELRKKNKIQLIYTHCDDP